MDEEFVDLKKFDVFMFDSKLKAKVPEMSETMKKALYVNNNHRASESNLNSSTGTYLDGMNSKIGVNEMLKVDPSTHSERYTETTLKLLQRSEQLANVIKYERPIVHRR